jgi:hypothetical protein
MLFDAIWFLAMLYFWGQDAKHDEVIWDSLKGLHHFILFLSCVNMVIRVILKRIINN